MKEDNLLTITKEDGTEVLCEILFTHHSDKFKKDYVLFVQKDTNEASAAVYTPNQNGEGNLSQVETEAEWEMLEQLLADYADSLEEENEGGCGSCGGGCGSCGDHDDEDHECGCGNHE
ncbi:MAG: DUF1292 domain-containing protein [Anaeroplasmataceae bacterium]